MLDDCRDGKIDMLITKSVTRFARKTLTTLEAVRELKNLNIDVFFEKENIHSISGDGELMLAILASFAQEESRSVSENCKWSIRKMFAKGKLANLRHLYGYDIKRGKIEINPVQAAVVAGIFEDYISGIGCDRIAKKLRDTQVSTVYGGTWSALRVASLLKNEKYVGDALLQKTFVSDHLAKKKVKNIGQLPKYYAKNTHPPIVSRGTFEKAQRIMAERGLKCTKPNSAQNRYPFTGLILCDICGKHYRRKITVAGTKNAKPVWICRTFSALGRESCASGQIPESVLTEKAAEALGLPVFDEAVFAAEIAEIRIPEHGRLLFVFRNGHTENVAWQNPSRRHSWTNEMKQAARERQSKIWEERRKQNETKDE
jgi:DNA invertase Pin-like site-specific DNA recombinase